MKFIAILLFASPLLHIERSQGRPFLMGGNETIVLIQNFTSNEDSILKTIEKDTLINQFIKESNQINYSNYESDIVKSTIELKNDSAAVNKLTTNVNIRKGTYKCWIYADSSFSYIKRKGFIHSTGDSSIVFKVSSTGNTFYTDDWLISSCPVSKIYKIKIRRKGSVGKGLLIGTAMGFLTGFTLGYAGITDYGILESLPPAENGAVGGILFSIPGSLIGGIIGAFRVNIPIKRNQLEYEKQKQQIASYSLTKL